MQDGGRGGWCLCAASVTSVCVGTSGLWAFIPILCAQPSTLQTGEVVRGFCLRSLQKIKTNPKSPTEKSEGSEVPSHGWGGGSCLVVHL